MINLLLTAVNLKLSLVFEILWYSIYYQNSHAYLSYRVARLSLAFSDDTNS